jgi:hypothetical protein
MALLLVLSTAAAYIVMDAAVPLPKEGSQFLISGLRADVRGDMVRGMSYLPLMCGTWWLAKSNRSRRRSVTLFFAVVGFASLIHLLEALLILSLSPGALTGSSAGFRWESKDAYSAAHLDTWATALAAIAAWGVWRYRKAARTNAAA